MSFTNSGTSYVNREITELLQNSASIIDQILILPGCVSTNLQINLDETNFFCEMWVNLASSAGSQHLVYVTDANNPGTGDDWSVRVEAGTQFFQFYVYTPDNIQHSVYSVAYAPVNTWTYVAISLQYSVMHLVVNGILQGEYVLETTPRFTPTSTIFIGTSASVLDWIPTQAQFKDIRIFQGGVTPTGSFTPAQAPFGPDPPPYVTGSTEIFNLGRQYMQVAVMDQSI
jgi:hypothetical protein